MELLYTEAMGFNAFYRLSGAVQRKFPMRSFPEARRLAKRAANKAGLNVKQRMEKTGKYSQEAKLKKQQARKQKKDSE